MWKYLMAINKNLVYAIPTLMLAGLAFGNMVDPSMVKQLKSLILPLTFLMVFPMMVTLNIQHLKQGLQPRIQGSAIFINFAIIPFAAFFLGKYSFANQPYMALGLLLASLLPTSGMTISWTGFARGNLGAAITMTVIGLTPGSLITPVYISILPGATVAVDFLKVVQQIGVIVFLPMMVGYMTRKWLLKKYGMEAFRNRIASRFPALSTIGVLGIVFVAIALKADTILANPVQLLGIFIPLPLLYLFNVTLSTLIGRRFFSRGDGIALVYGTVMRNLFIALAVAIIAFGEAGADAAMAIALAYIIQAQSAAWYVKFTDTIFGCLMAPQEA